MSNKITQQNARAAKPAHQQKVTNTPDVTATNRKPTSKLSLSSTPKVPTTTQDDKETQIHTPNFWKCSLPRSSSPGHC